jgi:hypothetical protein
VTLHKYFSHPSLVIYFFLQSLSRPPIELKLTETGTANRWGITNSKAPEPIIMMSQSEILSSSQIIFITLFSAGARRWCDFYEPSQNV